MSFSLVTSAWSARASPPSPLMMPAVSSAAAGLTSAQRTFAPSRAKQTAVALPLPQPGPLEPAPSTIATLSLRRSAMGLFLPRRIAFPQIRLQDLPVIVLRQGLDED